MNHADIENRSGKHRPQLLELEAHERKYYEKALATVSSGVVVVSADLRIHFSNRAFQQTIGLQSEEILGRRLENVLPITGLLEQALDVFAEGNPKHNIVFALARENTKHYYRASLVGIQRTVKKPKEALLILEELASPEGPRTETSEPTDAERRELVYRRLFETATDGILLLDADTGQIRDANPVASQLLALSRDELLSKRLWDLRPFHEIHSQRPLFRQLQDKGFTRYSNLSIPAPEGQSIELELSSTLFQTEDAKFIQLSMRDISERKQLEAQLRNSQKVEALRRLAGRMAEEFGTSVTALTRTADILASNKESHNSEQQIEEIKKASERATLVSNQLLIFSGNQASEPKVLDINDVIGGMGQMLRRLLGESIELLTNFDPAVGAVKSEPGQIRQLITNLAMNARDAMPQGGKLTIETADVTLGEEEVRHIAASPGRYVILSVSDTGTGMGTDLGARLFEPFFTTKEGKAMGLGLAAVVGIVKQSGGYLGAFSEPGEGTTFKIYFPREGEKPETQPAPAAAARGAETILVVEDKEGPRAVIRNILKRKGYVVLEVSQANDALQIGQQHQGPIHLLLTKTAAVPMSGPEIATRLSKLHPEMKTLYISGYGDDVTSLSSGLPAGAAFIQKPFTLDALLPKIREVLDMSVA